MLSIASSTISASVSKASSGAISTLLVPMVSATAGLPTSRAPPAGSSGSDISSLSRWSSRLEACCCLSGTAGPDKGWLLIRVFCLFDSHDSIDARRFAAIGDVRFEPSLSSCCCCCNCCCCFFISSTADTKSWTMTRFHSNRTVSLPSHAIP